MRAVAGAPTAHCSVALLSECASSLDQTAVAAAQSVSHYRRALAHSDELLQFRFAFNQMDRCPAFVAITNKRRITQRFQAFPALRAMTIQMAVDRDVHRNAGGSIRGECRLGASYEPAARHIPTSATGTSAVCRSRPSRLRVHRERIRRTHPRAVMQSSWLPMQGTCCAPINLSRVDEPRARLSAVNLGPSCIPRSTRWILAEKIYWGGL